MHPKRSRPSTPTSGSTRFTPEQLAAFTEIEAAQRALTQRGLPPRLTRLSDGTKLVGHHRITYERNAAGTLIAHAETVWPSNLAELCGWDAA